MERLKVGERDPIRIAIRALRWRQGLRNISTLQPHKNSRSLPLRARYTHSQMEEKTEVHNTHTHTL